ncbi:hypothetical protein [Nocardioides convexus]|uniref:ATP-binding protein n=1 Tax=Nocardioides convexus TaxID=2712224 RepID=UPI002418626A|nr:hypothetical protein [Nocardioides convexus]
MAAACGSCARSTRLAGEIEKASSEAESAFGDGTVFVEPYVESGRHIEVQVLGTPEGTIVLGERDCSVQRRHQKVIEEAPAPALPEATRTALHDAARAAAEAIDYRGAGTVEFLYDPAKDRFYFLEMNTRLQVEHPVTEAVYGVDLVALQIAVAEGHSPSVSVGEPNGHAVEVRLYAEDPAHDYQPQSGRISRFDVPGVVSAFEGPASYGVRLDSGVGSGEEIGTFYDAMIAKVIVHAPTREQALRQARRCAGEGPPARPGHQPRPARQPAARPGAGGREDAHHLARHRRPGRPRGRARRRGHGRACRRSRPPSRSLSGPGCHVRCRARSPPAGATSSPRRR